MGAKRMAAMTLAMAAMGLGALHGGTAAAGGEDRWLAPVDVRPHGGHEVSGAARLTGAPSGRAGIIAILIGLQTVDAGGNVHLAFSRARCAELADVGDLQILPQPLAVAPDGSAHVDRPLPNGVANARSLAVVGDWNGDGTDGVAACGDIARLTPAGGNEDADGVLVTTRQRAAQTGDGQILGNLLYTVGVHARGGAVFTGLVAGAAYDVGLSRRPCGRGAQAKNLHPDIPLAQVVADERGTAYASVTDVSVAGSDWRSLVVSSSGANAVVGCARTDTLEVMPAD